MAISSPTREPNEYEKLFQEICKSLPEKPRVRIEEQKRRLEFYFRNLYNAKLLAIVPGVTAEKEIESFKGVIVNFYKDNGVAESYGVASTLVYQDNIVIDDKITKAIGSPSRRKLSSESVVTFDQIKENISSSLEKLDEGQKIFLNLNKDRMKDYTNQYVFFALLETIPSPYAQRIFSGAKEEAVKNISDIYLRYYEKADADIATKNHIRYVNLAIENTLGRTDLRQLDSWLECEF